MLNQRAEDLGEDDERSQRGSTLRDDAQVTGDWGGSTLVGVGRPEVEGYERELEAQSAEEEHQSGNGQQNLLREGIDAAENGSHIGEIERACSSIEQ